MEGHDLWLLSNQCFDCLFWWRGLYIITPSCIPQTGTQKKNNMQEFCKFIFCPAGQINSSVNFWKNQKETQKRKSQKEGPRTPNRDHEVLCFCDWTVCPVSRKAVAKMINAKNLMVSVHMFMAISKNCAPLCRKEVFQVKNAAKLMVAENLWNSIVAKWPTR